MIIKLISLFIIAYLFIAMLSLLGSIILIAFGSVSGLDNKTRGSLLILTSIIYLPVALICFIKYMSKIINRDSGELGAFISGVCVCLAIIFIWQGSLLIN